MVYQRIFCNKMSKCDNKPSSTLIRFTKLTTIYNNTRDNDGLNISFMTERQNLGKGRHTEEAGKAKHYFFAFLR